VTIIPGLLTGEDCRLGDTRGGELKEDEDEELLPGDPRTIRSTAARTTFGDTDISTDILDIFWWSQIRYKMRILYEDEGVSLQSTS
jgi:hypothetical protein